MKAEHPLQPTAFPVSDVAPASSPLPETSTGAAISQLLSGDGDRAMFLGLDVEPGRRGRPVPRRKLAGGMEAMSNPGALLVEDIGFHPFLAALHFAFCDHRPVRISPDAVWLLITQGVAHHLNAHAEELRSRLVKHQGRLTLTVRRDDFVKGSPDNPWDEVFPAFSRQIRDHVGEELHDFFVAGFSTTGAVEKAAHEIGLMDAMQSVFEYRILTVCGIPGIVLEGTPGDWRALADRARQLSRFDLERWGACLAEILEEFVAASRGAPDRHFWKSIYRFMSISGGCSVTGWITAFFPYLKAGSSGRPTVPNRLIETSGSWRETLAGADPDRGPAGRDGPNMDRFPSGLSCAPLHWDYLGRPFDLQVLGGFVGVSQDPRTLSLRPELGWAVLSHPES